MPVRFGLAYDFRNPERWQRSWADVFAELLDQIVFAEELGFDSIWITEHHFAEDGYAPCPTTLLAAIAARTKRVQLSTDILLLPLYHAVRLAEEVATIDILSGGRMMLGIGMGYRDEEFAAFGTSRKERAARTEEGIAVLRGAWADGPFSFSGRFYNLSNVNVTPKPVQKPHPPLWLATTSVQAARRAARLGLNLLPQGDMRNAYYPWLEELERQGKKPSDYRIGLIKPWFVTDSRDDPVWQAAAEHERYRWDVYRPWIQAGGFPESPEGDPEPIDQTYIVGPPGEVVDRLHRVRERLPVTDFVSWGTPVGMEPGAVRPYLERFAKDVMPQFKDAR
jgi:probable F420-dependent oxidoreductase